MDLLRGGTAPQFSLQLPNSPFFAIIFVEHILGYNFAIDLMLKLLSRKEGIVAVIQECASFI
jgi:hypothetical protein